MMSFQLQLVIFFHLFVQLFAQSSNVILTRWINSTNDVIRSIPFATMTSCFMDCSRNNQCSNLGFDQNPVLGLNAYCHLLTNIGTGKEKVGLKKMFLLVDASRYDEEKEEVIEENKVQWKRLTLLDGQPHKVKANNLITTIKKFTKQYVFNVQILLKTYITNASFINVVHLTQGGDRENYGDRTPSISLNKDKPGQITIESSVNGDTFYQVKTAKRLRKNVWIRVKVQQLLQHNGYNYSCYINGKLIESVINLRPSEFKDVKVYASNPYQRSQPALLRNMWIDLEDDTVENKPQCNPEISSDETETPR